jgi:fructose-1,6-bisphosphatase-3
MGRNRSRKTSGTTKKQSTLIKARGIDELAQRLLQVETELNANIPTTLWISDLHGEGDRFKSILRGRFGVLYQTCREALPNTFTTDKVQYLVSIIRQQQYIADQDIRMDTQDVILCLVQILKYKLTNARYQVDANGRYRHHVLHIHPTSQQSLDQDQTLVSGGYLCQ